MDRHTYSLVQLFMLCVIPHTASADTYSSTASIVQLAEMESQYFDSLQAFRHRKLDQDRLSEACSEWKEEDACKDLEYVLHLKRIMDDMQMLKHSLNKNDDNNLSTLEAYTGHPISAFKLIKRWVELREALYHFKDGKKLWKEMADSRNDLPTQSDVVGAVEGIIRLQVMYLLRTEDVSQGVIRNHSSLHKLTTGDCLLIASTAQKVHQSELSMEWLFTCGISNQAEYGVSEYKKIIKKYLNKSQITAFIVAKKVIQFYPDDEDIREMYNSLLQSQQEHTKPLRYTPGSEHPLLSYQHLCQQQSPFPTYLNSIKDPDSHVCRYTSHTLPYVTYKEEILNTDPWVVFYHDVISDEEINIMKKTAFPELFRATIKAGDNLEGQVVPLRVSKVSWLLDYKHDNMTDLSKRVAEITGLNTHPIPHATAGEPFQVVNYGVGGQYEPHYDYYGENPNQELPQFLVGAGDRMATFMFYLSHVTEGGSTVFPMLDMSVPPLKNGALFWYNLKHTGEADSRTLHAGCPVVIGQKWVANKWIRARQQIWKRPCQLQQT